MKSWKLVLCASAFSLGLAGLGVAHADPLASPAMTAPLSSNANPLSVDAGPLGKIYVSGQVSGIGYTQSHPTDNGVGDKSSYGDLSNAQVEIQKTDGPIQFYIQAGQYSLMSLGTQYVKSDIVTPLTYTNVPVAYLKVAPTSSFSVMAGRLPTLIGAEYTFSFQNMNIERGLLWNQEPAISQGVQVNYSHGPLSMSFAVTDGFFSSKLSTLSGLASYAIDSKDTIAFAGSGNVSNYTRPATFVTSTTLQNSQVFNLMYTRTDGPYLIEPYLQYTHVDANPAAGIPNSASTWGAAVLAKYSFNPEISLAGRVEYISASGGPNTASATNLLYGPHSNAFSLTITPTWQRKAVFVRGEFSYTHASDILPGFGFGVDSGFNHKDQTRGVIEAGIMF
ncbi:outer membrane beta-barrel protein [Caulobacter sp. KR2-114]|uniref:outer membrane beta-barrel protein n=1 Tax=Caulobacter sp. KR2-114 TaxID=3400912 RepID=UPI003C09983D